MRFEINEMLLQPSFKYRRSPFVVQNKKRPPPTSTRNGSSNPRASSILHRKSRLSCINVEHDEVIVHIGHEWDWFEVARYPVCSGQLTFGSRMYYFSLANSIKHNSTARQCPQHIFDFDLIVPNDPCISWQN